MEEPLSCKGFRLPAVHSDHHSGHGSQDEPNGGPAAKWGQDLPPSE